MIDDIILPLISRLFSPVSHIKTPDYKTAMELKYASMTRNQANKKPTGSTISGFNSASTSTNIPNKQSLNVHDIPDNIPIGNLGLSPHQLLQIIEEQRYSIRKVKFF